MQPETHPSLGSANSSEHIVSIEERALTAHTASYNVGPKSNLRRSSRSAQFAQFCLGRPSIRTIRERAAKLRKGADQAIRCAKLFRRGL